MRNGLIVLQTSNFVYYKITAPKLRTTSHKIKYLKIKYLSKNCDKQMFKKFFKLCLVYSAHPQVVAGHETGNVNFVTRFNTQYSSSINLSEKHVHSTFQDYSGKTHSGTQFINFCTDLVVYGLAFPCKLFYIGRTTKTLR